MLKAVGAVAIAVYCACAPAFHGERVEPAPGVYEQISPATHDDEAENALP